MLALWPFTAASVLLSVWLRLSVHPCFKFLMTNSHLQTCPPAFLLYIDFQSYLMTNLPHICLCLSSCKCAHADLFLDLQQLSVLCTIRDCLQTFTVVLLPLNRTLRCRVNTIIDFFPFQLLVMSFLLVHPGLLSLTDIQDNETTGRFFSDVSVWYSFWVNCSGLKMTYYQWWFNNIILWLLKLELYLPFNLFAVWDCKDFFCIQSNKHFIELIAFVILCIYSCLLVI